MSPIPAPLNPLDYYAEPPPSAWRKHADWFWAAGVFFFTVVLTVVSFPPFAAGEFAYAFAVPTILWAYRKPSFKRYALTVFAAQAVAWTLLLGWLHHVTWLGLLLLGPFIGAWVGLWYLAVWWTMPRMLDRPTSARLGMMLGLAAVWVLLEWTRTWFLGGFPWLPLAASQWKQVSVLQVASYTGAFGISYVLIAVNLGFAAYAHRLFFERKLRGLNRRSQEFFLAMFLLLACLAVHVQETTNRGQFLAPLGRVALVQPYIPQAVKWDPERAPAILEILRDTSERALAPRQRPDLILWPEATTPFALNADPGIRDWTERLVARLGVPLLLGSVGIENVNQTNEIWTNGAYVVDPMIGLQTTSYTKRKLVPFGEYVPFRSVLGWLEKITDAPGGDIVAGMSASPLLVTTPTGALALGPLICYEDIFPSLARDSARSGAEVLAVLTNNAWFGEGGAAYQHAAHSVLRAVETRRPLVRCGNGGWSGWIDEFGKIRAEMKNREARIYFRGAATYELTRDTRWVDRQSFYTRHGDWFVAVCAALAGFGFLLLRYGAPAQSQDEPA
jgi:apolipoprotein N-acyltransferase